MAFVTSQDLREQLFPGLPSRLIVQHCPGLWSPQEKAGASDALGETAGGGALLEIHSLFIINNLKEA